MGKRMAGALSSARAQVASLIGAQEREIVFTSGATESVNLALRGAAAWMARDGADGIPQLVTCATEHPAVLRTAGFLEDSGWRVTTLGVDEQGDLVLDELARALGSGPSLVSLMLANNEIGNIFPMREIARMCHEADALLHTDAAQAVGHLSIDVRELDVDLLSLSSHKLYGPQGVGALFVNQGMLDRIVPQITGGGQERGIRSGTPNTAGCVGLGVACELAKSELVDEAGRVAGLRDLLAKELEMSAGLIRINGPSFDRRLPGNLHVTFLGVDAEAVMANCPSVAMSTGSACSSSSPAPSHVLSAIGMNPNEADSSIRLSLGRFSTADDVRLAAREIGRAVAYVRGTNYGLEPRDRVVVQ